MLVILKLTTYYQLDAKIHIFFQLTDSTTMLPAYSAVSTGFTRNIYERIDGEVASEEQLSEVRNIVNSCYFKVQIHPKLLISQSKFSDPRKVTLR